MNENEIAKQIEDHVHEHLTAFSPKHRRSPFRAAIFRGLGVVLPPLLTLVILLWIGGTVNTYVIQPLFAGSQYLILLAHADIISAKPANKTADGITVKGKKYARCGDGTFVPESIYAYVENAATEGVTQMPQTGVEVYEQYVRLVYLRPYLFIPVVVLLFTLIIYLLGKFIAARAGRLLWDMAERLVNQVPLVREVYGAVKKMIDLAFGESELRVSRVVAVEWPRKGVWALALVTSEGFTAMENVVGEPMYAVLIPTSPMPATGFTLHVKRSETVDIGITIDQAIQFVVSCGVVAIRSTSPGAR